MPLFGPRSVRDGVGVVVDWYTDPLILIDDDTVRWSLIGLDIVDIRADLLNASRVIDQAALDPYSFIRRLPAAAAEPRLRRQSAGRIGWSPTQIAKPPKRGFFVCLHQ